MLSISRIFQSLPTIMVLSLLLLLCPLSDIVVVLYVFFHPLFFWKSRNPLLSLTGAVRLTTTLPSTPLYHRPHPLPHQTQNRTLPRTHPHKEFWKKGRQRSKIHAQYDWTTGALDNGNEWRKFCAVPRLYPLRSLVCTLFKKGGSRGAFRLPGAGGDHFHCTVEPSPGHIRCRKNDPPPRLDKSTK